MRDENGTFSASLPRHAERDQAERTTGLTPRAVGEFRVGVRDGLETPGRSLVIPGQREFKQRDRAARGTFPGFRRDLDQSPHGRGW